MSDKQSTIKLASLYEMNKAAVQAEKPLKRIELKDKLKEIKKFFSNFPDRYFMLLCRERYDFTIFNFCNGKTDSTLAHGVKDIQECLENRGTIISIDQTENRNAYEIWLIIDEQAFVYYLFPYNQGVLEQ